MSLWCLHFLPKNEQKQVDKSNVPSFFGKNVSLKSPVLQRQQRRTRPRYSCNSNIGTLLKKNDRDIF